MNEQFDTINDSLDIEVQAGEIVKETKQKLKDINKKDDPTSDYEYTRGNLYSLIEKGELIWGENLAALDTELTENITAESLSPVRVCVCLRCM